MTTISRVTRAGLFLLLAATLTSGLASAQIDLSGAWTVRLHEDIQHRNDALGGGPRIGDYTGLPINDAARAKADSWDASIFSARERQTIVQPGAYGSRGGGSMRISKDIDETTQRLVAIKIYRAAPAGSTTRTIWMDQRAHPPEWAAHTWQGFSTGRWEGDMLTVETTHLKMGWLQRNGVAASDRTTITEHFVRHGAILTLIALVRDPVYLEEPFMRSTNFVLDQWETVGAVSNEIVDEIAGRPDGYVPHHLPGTNVQLKEFAEEYRLPFEATRGGKDTTYPEYQLTLKQLMAKPQKKSAD